MLYAKIKNNEVVKYPYDYADLQAENPYTQYGSTDVAYWFPLTEEASKGYNVVVVDYTAQPQYDADVESIREAAPVLSNGQWNQVWETYSLTDEEIQQKQDAKKEHTKLQAEQLLLSSDWVEYPSVTDTSKTPHLTNLTEWVDYRVALRAIAINPLVTVDQWPVRPQEVWSQ